MTRPLSEVLLDFAGVAASDLAVVDEDELESRLQLALLVWNTVLLASDEERKARRQGTDPDVAFEQVIDHLVYALRTRLGAPPPDVETLVQYLVVRKLEDFADDERGIAGYTVEHDPSGAARLAVLPMAS